VYHASKTVCRMARNSGDYGVSSNAPENRGSQCNNQTLSLKIQGDTTDMQDGVQRWGFVIRFYLSSSYLHRRLIVLCACRRLILGNSDLRSTFSLVALPPPISSPAQAKKSERVFVMSHADLLSISFKHVPETTDNGLVQGSESRIDPLMVGLEIADRRIFFRM
jgi:hypothetical protein